LRVMTLNLGSRRVSQPGPGRGALGRHGVADGTGDPDAKRRHVAHTPDNSAPAVLATTAPERALAPRSAPPPPSPALRGRWRDMVVVSFADREKGF